MTELGDRLREFAALCDSHPRMKAAGVIVRPTETVVAAFVDTEDGAETVAMALYHGVSTPPVESMFREVDEEVGG